MNTNLLNIIAYLIVEKYNDVTSNQELFMKKYDIFIKKLELVTWSANEIFEEDHRKNISLFSIDLGCEVEFTNNGNNVSILNIKPGELYIHKGISHEGVMFKDKYETLSQKIKKRTF
jgi:hypothetical protein